MMFNRAASFNRAVSPIRAALGGIALFALLLCLLLAAVPTHAGFTAGFAGDVEAAGKIDIAQSSEQDGQHATDKDAGKLRHNGLPVQFLGEGGAASARNPTAVVSMPVVNLSEDALVTLSLFVRDRGGADLLPHLRLGARLSGEDRESELVTGDDAAEGSTGLVVPGVLEPGAEGTVDISVWLADEAPDEALGATVDMLFRLVGETAPGESPITVEGTWS